MQGLLELESAGRPLGLSMAAGHVIQVEREAWNSHSAICPNAYPLWDFWLHGQTFHTMMYHFRESRPSTRTDPEPCSL